MNKQEGYTGDRKKGEYIANIIFNLIFLWILSRVPHWNIPFLADDYMVVLLVMKINCWVQIAANIVLLVMFIRALRYVVKIIAEAAGLAALMVMYNLYPFDFSNYHNLGWLDKVLPILFIIGMVVAVVKIFTYAVKVFFRPSAD